MDTEIQYLETRVAALIERVRELESRNGRFAEALSQALKDNAELNYRLEEARSRVGALISRLPCDEEVNS
ncbi:hypothetical protein [Paludibacterium paludis]|nr:hypothetical protein [Paludibacterium paludis]